MTSWGHKAREHIPDFLPELPHPSVEQHHTPLVLWSVDFLTGTGSVFLHNKSLSGLSRGVMDTEGRRGSTGADSCTSCPAAISTALLTVLDAPPRPKEEEFWFSVSVVNLVDFGGFLMQ